MKTATDTVADFFAQYPQRVVDKRQLLIQPQDEVQNVFYLVEGRVNQYDITPAGNEMVVNVFKPGAFFPMSSAINHTPAGYFFEAGTKVVVRVAPADDVTQFLREYPEILFDLLSRVYRGMDGVLRRMTHLMRGDAKTRLVFELLNVAARFGEPHTDGSVRIVLTEGDLARQSGLARETVSRTLQGLKQAELISLDRRGVVIRNTKELELLLG